MSRRSVVLGAGAGALAGAALASLGAWGWGAGATGRSAASGAEVGAPHAPTGIDAYGPTQAGVVRPGTPQRHALIAVGDVDRAALAAALPELGREIRRLTAEGDPVLLPDGPADLTALVGLGPASLTAVSGRREYAELIALPAFAGDDVLPADARGGDLLLSVNASDPGVLEPVLAVLTARVPGWRPRWAEFAFRGPGDDGIARNPFGFLDGIIVPRGEDELARDVWIGDGPLAGGTVCVIRHFLLDTGGFGANPIAEQNAIIGRDKITGAPLTGGEMHSEVDVMAKSPAGELVIPLDAHARAAHPSFTGSPLMLRRSYSSAPRVPGRIEPGAGLVFTAFQAEVRTFVATQQRLDEADALMAYVSPLATAAFLILPGFDDARPLGSPLTG